GPLDQHTCSDRGDGRAEHDQACHGSPGRELTEPRHDDTGEERGRGRADRLTQRRYNGADTRGVTVAGAEREVALEVGGRAVAVAGCDACDRAIVPGSAPFRRDPDRGAERELGVAQTSLVRTRESGYERADCRRRDRSAVRLCELREMLGDGRTVVGTRQQDVAAILEDRGVTVSDRLQCTRTP